MVSPDPISKHFRVGPIVCVCVHVCVCVCMRVCMHVCMRVSECMY